MTAQEAQQLGDIISQTGAAGKYALAAVTHRVIVNGFTDLAVAVFFSLVIFGILMVTALEIRTSDGITFEWAMCAGMGILFAGIFVILFGIEAANYLLAPEGVAIERIISGLHP